MRGEGWIRFEGYEGRLDPKYAGKYKIGGIRYPLIERTRTWDIVRVEGEPSDDRYSAGQFTVLSRGHDMMQKAHEEAAAYRLHFKRCEGVGRCQDIGHPGGPRRSLAQALAASGASDTAEPSTDQRAKPVEEPPVVEAPISPTSDDDWAISLLPSAAVVQRTIRDGVVVRVIPLEFQLWEGPRLTMAEDCNKRGGRVIGDRGELSCAEVEIVKRLRAAGWGAAWVQAWRCGRKSWGSYIAELADLPATVRSLQRSAGEAGGHPDVLGWRGDRVIALESKGPSDALKASQIEWFERAIPAGIREGDIGVVQWRVRRTPSDG
jgi:hypothetical protein